MILGKPRMVALSPAKKDENTISEKEPIVFPTKKLIVGSDDRKVSSIWVSESLHKAFIDACSLSGRKSCDVIEPFERAYVEFVKKVVFDGKFVPCPFSPLVVNLKLTVLEKYEKRGAKEGHKPKLSKPSFEPRLCHVCMEEIEGVDPSLIIVQISRDSRNYGSKVWFHKSCYFK